MDSLGDIINKLRREKELPLRKVAACLDIDQSILSRIERGRRKATRKQVVKLAEYFNVKENELLVAWLSDNVYYEVEDEQMALQALHIAEEKVNYRDFLRTDRKEIIDTMKRILKNFKVIKMAWIFGSFSRSDSSISSDIDVLIDVPTNEVFTLFDIAEIQNQLQVLVKRKVDIVMLSAIKPTIKERIKKEMKLIYEAR